MPDLGLDDMADSWSLDIQREITPPQAPALKNERKLISRGRKGNGRIPRRKRDKPFSVGIRPREWKDLKTNISTKDLHAARYITDAVSHYVGRPPVHFPDVKFHYPPLSLNTGEYLTASEKCSAYLNKISQSSARLRQRKEFEECVQELLLDAVESPEAVQFLNIMRKNPSQVPHFDASVRGSLVIEAASSELETYSTADVDVGVVHWKPVGFDVKEAAILPLVKQYFRDDHDLDVSLPPSFSVEEDDKGGIILSIVNIPSSASPSTIVDSLVEAARSWRSQKKKALLLKLLPTEYDQFLYPSLGAGFTIHEVEATGMMLVQDLLAHVHPEQVEEASFDSSDNWKSPWILDHQIADSCLPSARACLTDEADIYSFGILCYEIITALPSEPKDWVHSSSSFADFKPSKADSCIAPSIRPPEIIFGQDMTIDQDLPHLIRGSGTVGTLEIKQRAKNPVVADLPFSADCLEEPGDEPDSESEATDIPTNEEVLSGESGASLESHTEIAKFDSHDPRPEPSQKRSAISAFDEDSLLSKIHPFVNQQIEEALLPLISALRSREEDEHKHRQKMLALEQEKLALMRQKLECTRCSNAVPASVTK